MSTESVVQVELIRKERRFLWFSRLSGVSSCKLNAMCAKSGKFFYSNASADRSASTGKKVQVREILAGERLASFYRLCES